MDAEHHIERLDPATCWGLLRARQLGRLAVSIANHPDLFPVNYVVDAESIVFRSAEGTKLAAALLGQGVAFEADGEYEGLAWSVVVKGHAREIEGLEQVFAAEQLPLYPWESSPKSRFVRITAHDITGRRFLLGPRRVDATMP